MNPIAAATPDSTAAVPELSIVLACLNERTTLVRWLAAFEPQARYRRVELIVAIAGDDRWVRSLQTTTTFEVVSGDADALVPALWGLGMARARGAVIAVTITACVPADGWVDAILCAHHRDSPGIGGVIEIAPDATLVDRAIHLVRYTPYMPPLEAGIVDEIAGDNGTYKRNAILDLIPAIARDGFWEPEIHRVLRERGGELWLDPRISVTFSGSHSIRQFSRQRYLHGRTFGRARAAAGTGGSATRFRALLAPLVPLVMLARAFRALRARRRLTARTILAAPLAAWFLACWASGEAAGYASAERPLDRRTA